MEIKEFWVDKKKHSLQIKKIESNNFKISINNKEVEAKVLQFLPNNQLIFFQVNQVIYKVKIIEKQSKFFIFVYNQNKMFEVTKSHTQKFIPGIFLKKENKNSLSLTFKEELKSPLAGRIIKINVKQRQFVTKNQVLVIIESMKMENEIRAEQNAFIKTISIAQSDLVEQNQTLMTFEQKEEANAKTKNSNEKKTI